MTKKKEKKVPATIEIPLKPLDILVPHTVEIPLEALNILVCEKCGSKVSVEGKKVYCQTCGNVEQIE